MARMKLPSVGVGFTLKPARRARGGPGLRATAAMAVSRTETISVPGIATQMRNLAASGMRVLGGLMRGQLAASDATVARRHAICRENSCGSYRSADDRCGRCGCWLRAKAWLSVEKCPVGLW